MQLHNRHKRPLVVAVVAVAAAIPAAAPAQLINVIGGNGEAYTAVSVRMNGMGVDLNGIVDDPLTDAALNPARLAGIEGRQVYASRRGSRVAHVVFPDWDRLSSYNAYLPIERLYYGNVTATESVGELLEFSWNAPAFGSWTAAFNAEVSFDGSNSGSAQNLTQQTSYYGGSIDATDLVESRTTELQLASVNVALCSTQDPGAGAFGVRLDALYHDSETGDSRLDVSTLAPLDDLGEQDRRFDLRKLRETMRRVEGGLTVGWFNPSGVLREASVRAAGSVVSNDIDELRQYIEDEDYDGNGVDPDGSTPIYEYRLKTAASERDLEGGSAEARAVLEHGPRWRSRYAVSVARLTGDGNGDFQLDNTFRSNSTSTQLEQALLWEYDTDISHVGASAALGFAEDISEAVLFAAVARVSYSRDEYDETASGSARATYVEDGTGGTMESPARQTMNSVEENVEGTLTAGIEWMLPRYLTFRMGLLYSGNRSETDHAARRSVDELSSRDVLAGFSAGSYTYQYVSWNTDIAYRAGASVSLFERLWVDFYTTGWYFTEFSYATVRFAF